MAAGKKDPAESYNPIEAYENAEERPLSDVLRESGIALPPPEELDDSQLGEKLWEVIHALVALHVYLENTDHLSDRELYTELWSEILPEPTVLLPEDPSFGQHIDMVGSGSEEHVHLYLKYYADEETRADWLRSFPEDPLPEPEDPPYDRDQFLPQREFWSDEPMM